MVRERYPNRVDVYAPAGAYQKNWRIVRGVSGQVRENSNKSVRLPSGYVKIAIENDHL